MSTSTTTRIRDDSRIFGQVPSNAKIFHERYEPDLLADHRGQIAFMADGEYIDVFADYDAAFKYADSNGYRQGEYSLHHVGPAPTVYSGAYTAPPSNASTRRAACLRPCPR